MAGIYGVCDDNNNERPQHVYVVPPPPTTVPTVTPHPTFLEWLTLGKLSVIAGSVALIVVTVVSVIWGNQ